MVNSRKRILVDAREFDSPRPTGIGRFLSGPLAAALVDGDDWEVTLATTNIDSVPEYFRESNRIRLHLLLSKPILFLQ